MVVHRNQYHMVQEIGPNHLGHWLERAEPGTYYNGERIEYIAGEPYGDAVKRHLARKSKSATQLAKPPAKPAASQTPRKVINFAQPFNVGRRPA